MRSPVSVLPSFSPSSAPAARSRSPTACSSSTGGRLLLDAPREEALAWLAANRPAFLPPPDSAGQVLAGHVRVPGTGTWPEGAPAVELSGVSFAYDRVPVLDGVSLSVARGEVVVLEGPNGCGKTTLAKLACGLLEPTAGSVRRAGRACYLSQDPGRYLVRERVDEEVALAVGGDLRARPRRARRGWPRVGGRPVTRAISRAASASASGSLPSLSRSRTCSFSTSRPGASIRSARQALAAWLAAYAERRARGARRDPRPGVPLPPAGLAGGEGDCPCLGRPGCSRAGPGRR